MDIKGSLAKGIRTVFNLVALTYGKVNTKAKICSRTQTNNSSIPKYPHCGHDCFLLKYKIDSFVQ